MVLLKLFIFTLTLYELIANLDALTCPKGQRVVRKRGSNYVCDECPTKTYQPVENDSQHCKVCTKCNEKYGSVFIEKCTKVKNSICRCRGEFVPSDRDSSSCKCNIGFGIKNNECLKCDEGYFSTSINSQCQKWKECKSTGVYINGTTTSDAICNGESNTHIRAPASNNTISLITHLTSQRPHEEAQTQNIHTTTTTSVPQHSPKNERESTGNNSVVVFLILVFGILGLLVLTAVTCKLHIMPCMEREPPIPTSELCRCPVEESGGDSLSSLSKLNPEEP